MEELIRLVVGALQALDTIYPGFDPLKGHRSKDRGNGKSRFSDTWEQAYDCIQMLKEAAKVDVVPGKDGAVCVVAALTFTGGVAVVNRPVPGNTYRLETVHGCLQPVGSGLLSSHAVNEVTFVLTPETAPGGQRVFVLASVYPGRPDDDRPLPADWKQGQEVTGHQLIAAGVSRVVEG